MTPNDSQAFHDGIVGVMSFYAKDLSPFALDVWWNALAPYDLPAIIAAFNAWVRNPDSGQFPPKPADIIRMLDGRTEDRALSAWAKVDKGLRLVGTHRSVVFDDALIHRVLHDMGGWIALGQKTEDEWPFVAREFATRYRGFSSRGDRPDYPRVLVGIAEAYNGSKGLANDPPRLIGDPMAAQRVMAGGTTSPLVSITTAGDMAAAALRLVDADQDAA